MRRVLTIHPRGNLTGTADRVEGKVLLGTACQEVVVALQVQGMVGTVCREVVEVLLVQGTVSMADLVIGTQLLGPSTLRHLGSAKMSVVYKENIIFNKQKYKYVYQSCEEQ